MTTLYFPLSALYSGFVMFNDSVTRLATQRQSYALWYSLDQFWFYIKYYLECLTN